MYNPKTFKKILLILSLLVLVIFVGYYFVYQDIKSRNEHISSLTAELATQSDRQEYFVSTQRMLENIAPDVEHIDSSIVARDGDVAFIEELESVAKSNNLAINISSLHIDDDTKFPASDVTSFRIQAKTEGSWVGTYTFLAQLESLPVKVQVTRFALANTLNDENKKQPVSLWQSSFEIRVLKYK